MELATPMDQPVDLDLGIEYHSGIPVYRQIINGINAAVSSGTLQVGDRLPTIRELSSRLDVNPNTVAKAYREMELTQLVETRGRNGSRISAPPDGEGALSVAARRKVLERIYATALAEARAHGIDETELGRYAAQRAGDPDSGATRRRRT